MEKKMNDIHKGRMMEAESSFYATFQSLFYLFAM